MPSDTSKIRNLKGELEEQSVDRVTPAVADAADRAVAAATEASERVTAFLDDPAMRVRRQPLIAVGIAFAAGYLVRFLLVPRS